MTQSPTMDDVRAAAGRIEGIVHRTPVLTSSWLNGQLGAELFFKCENFQKTGSFKLRGAANTVLLLTDEEAQRGVLTGSSGNHGQGLACAAARRHIPAYVVMPENAAAIKVAAVRGYGGKVTFASADPQARLKQAETLQEETGAVYVHPFNDPRIIAGQGTAALELIEQTGGLDLILTPIGGGGLTSGTALVAAAHRPPIEVIAAEPAGADDAFCSLEAGRIVPQTDPRTIADGLRSSLGDVTFAILQERLAGIVTVSEEAIVRAMRAVWERMKIVIEPSAAVPVAALLEGKVNAAGKRVGVILSGGNVDLDRLPWIEAEGRGE